MRTNRGLDLLGVPDLPVRAFVKEFGQIKPQGGPSGGGPTSQTVTQTNIPEYARPYAEEMLGSAQALTDINQNPFQAFDQQRFAGFSPMQAQAFQNVAGQQVAPQLTDASNLAFSGAQQGLGAQPMAAGLQANALQYGGLGSEYGALGALSTPQAQQYGAQGVGIGQMGVQAAQQGFGAGQQYTDQATSPEAMQSFMSPFMQNVVDSQQREARRASEIQQQGIQSQAAQQGAFGGSRSAILEAERERNLGTQLGDIQAAGLQRAYEQAQQAQQFGAGLGIQGLQAGFGGLGVGLQGAETGLRGIDTGLRGTAQGIQGAEAGLRGVGQATDAGRFGLSGAQLGISGAGQLGQLGQEQYAQEMGITDAMQKFGALQQGQQQQDLDFGYQQFLAKQQYPYQQLSYMSDLLRGVPSAQSAQLRFDQQPNQTAQLLGAGLGAYGAFGRKEGGQIKSYQEGGQVKKYGPGGDVSPTAMSTMAVHQLPKQLKRLSDAQLAAYARSVKDAITLSAVQSEMMRRSKVRAPMSEMPQETVADDVVKRASEASIGQPRVSMYGGGIVALQGGGVPSNALDPLDQIRQVEQIRQQLNDATEQRKAAMQALRSFGSIQQRQDPEGYAAAKQAVEEAKAQQDTLARHEARVSLSTRGSNPMLEMDGGVSEGSGMPEQLANAPLSQPDESTADATTPVGIPAAGEDRRQEQAPQAGPTQGAMPSPANMSFDQWRQASKPEAQSPEDIAVLDDMKARVDSRMARAEGQENTAKFDAILMAGLAMMGGTSLADGIARAAQTGGATFLAGKKDAAKAVDAAEDADLAFNKYKLALRKGDEKEAREQFNGYMNHIADMEKLGVTRELGLAKVNATIAKNEAIASRGLSVADMSRSIKDHPDVVTAENQLKGTFPGTDDYEKALKNHNNVYTEVYRQVTGKDPTVIPNPNVQRYVRGADGGKGKLEQ